MSTSPRAFGDGYQPFLYQINDTVRSDAVTVRAGIMEGKTGIPVFPERDAARPEFRGNRHQAAFPTTSSQHEFLIANAMVDDTLVAPRLFLSSIIGIDVEKKTSQAVPLALVEPVIASVLRTLKSEPQGEWEDSLWMLSFATKLLAILREGKSVQATHLLIEPYIVNS